jgi:hypothetical protein
MKSRSWPVTRVLQTVQSAALKRKHDRRMRRIDGSAPSTATAVSVPRSSPKPDRATEIAEIQPWRSGMAKLAQ